MIRHELQFLRKYAPYGITGRTDDRVTDMHRNDRDATTGDDLESASSVGFVVERSHWCELGDHDVAGARHAAVDRNPGVVAVARAACTDV